MYDDFVEVTMDVNSTCIPDIVGKKGTSIRKLKDTFDVEIKLPSASKDSSEKVQVSIAGSKTSVNKAKDAIQSICLYQHHEVTHPGMVHEELVVPTSSLRFIIGKSGSELRQAEALFGVRVSVPRENSENPNVVIVGSPSDVVKAKEHFEQVLSKAQNAPAKEGVQSSVQNTESATAVN